MKYYPVNLDINKRACLVVGGGRVGTRKVGTLLRCGAAVTVVSLTFTERLRDLADQQKVTLIHREYRGTDLNGCFLVIGATNIEALNRQISADADERQMLCNIADFPETCNFILPAIVERGDLLIAVSTCGQSPAFAKKLREDLERRFGPEYEMFLQLMGAIRQKLLQQDHAPEAHKPLFETLIARGLLDLIREERLEEVQMLMDEVLGSAFDAQAVIENVFIRL